MDLERLLQFLAPFAQLGFLGLDFGKLSFGDGGPAGVFALFCDGTATAVS
jgi:hypothetical protein